MTAERRAKAFAAGTVGAASTMGAGDQAARFYAAEAAKVLQAYFHAAALDGCSLDVRVEVGGQPAPSCAARGDPADASAAAPFWDGLLRGALHGDERTAGNTITTLQQALALFFQTSIRRRCTPAPGRPATDLSGVIAARRDRLPARPGGPVRVGVAPDDRGRRARPRHRPRDGDGLAYGRLCPPFLACLDELPSTTPLPTLRTRMANERALGLSFIYAAQTWRQLAVCYGEDEARALFGLSNNLVVFGGGKDGEFYKEVSDLLGMTRVSRRSYNLRRDGWGTSCSEEDVPVLRPEEIRRLPERHALVVAENARPFVARLSRCIDGRQGKALAPCTGRSAGKGSGGTTVTTAGLMAAPFPEPAGVIARLLDESVSPQRRRMRPSTRAVGSRCCRGRGTRRAALPRSAGTSTCGSTTSSRGSTRTTPGVPIAWSRSAGTSIRTSFMSSRR